MSLREWIMHRYELVPRCVCAAQSRQIERLNYQLDQSRAALRSSYDTNDMMRSELAAMRHHLNNWKKQA